MNQMPLTRLTDSQKQELERGLVDKIGRLEERRETEKERRSDWNKATARMETDISQTARKLREDDAAPTPEESAEDRQIAEETAERILDHEESSISI